MKEVAKTIPIPGEVEESAGTMDVHLATLLRTEDLVEQLREQLQQVDLAAMKRAYGIAAKRPSDIEQVRQEKKCLEDDYYSLQEKYTKLKHEAEGKDAMVEILNAQVNEHISELSKWSERMTSLQSETLLG